MFRRRLESYDPKEDVEGIIRKLMEMDERLVEILRRLDEEDDGEDVEEQD